MPGYFYFKFFSIDLFVFFLSLVSHSIPSQTVLLDWLLFVIPSQTVLLDWLLFVIPSQTVLLDWLLFVIPSQTGYYSSSSHIPYASSASA